MQSTFLLRYKAIASQQENTPKEGFSVLLPLPASGHLNLSLQILHRQRSKAPGHDQTSIPLRRHFHYRPGWSGWRSSCSITFVDENGGQKLITYPQFVVIDVVTREGRKRAVRSLPSYLGRAGPPLNYLRLARWRLWCQASGAD